MDTATRSSIRPRRTGVWIVDPRRADYDGLQRSRNATQLAVRFFDSALGLLREWRVVQPDVCLVSIRLPDLSGFDVVEMLRPFPQGTAVGMVADSYSADDEVHGLSLGVHFFLCKPLEAEVLAECCRKHPRAAEPHCASAAPALETR